MPTPNNNIPYVPQGTLDPAAGLNLSLDVIDALLQTSVISMSATAPPMSPTNGDRYIVGTPATGAWSGEENNLARYMEEGATWQFYEAGTQVSSVINQSDGGIYIYQTGDSPPSWTLVAGLSDAPSDGQIYGRQDGAWVEAGDGGGGDAVSTESIGKKMSAAYTASITNPTTMAFKITNQQKHIQPMCPNMRLLFDDLVQNNGLFTLTGNTVAPTYSQSQMQVASTAASFSNGMNMALKTRFEHPGVCIMLDQITVSPDANANALGIFMFKDDNNWISATIQKGSGTSNRIDLAKFVAGVYTLVTNTANSSLPAALSGLALEVSPSGNCTVWQNVSNYGWEPILTGSVTNWDFMSPAELATWTGGIQVTGGVTTRHRIGSMSVGYQGQKHLRDFRLVTLLDGTPYVSDGYLYFTATTEGCSVFRMNPKNGAYEKVGFLYMERGGVKHYDLNAHIVYDKANAVWHVFWATWGNNSFTNVRMWRAEYKGDILNGMHLITGGSQITLSQTTGNNATYDPTVVYDEANSRWLMSYTLSPSGTFGGNYYSVLDESTDLLTWTNVWAKSGTTGYEGSWLAVIGGEYFVISGNGSNFRCWDVAGTDLGTMTVDSFPSPGGDPPAHLVVFPWFNRGVTEYYAMSWNNTQFSVGGSALGVFATGTPILYRSTTLELGFQFDAIGIR